MTIDKNTKFVQWLLTRPGIPLMLTSENADGSFFMIPFKHLINLSYRKDASTWMYAFVNKDKKMYKMAFASINELVDVLFDAKEFVYGSEHIPNPLFESSREEMLIQYDLTQTI